MSLEGNIKNYILFFLTILTTIWCGTLLFGCLLQGVIFSFSIMSILLVHEMGHYLNARKHNIDVTLPYFIPVPFSIGTLGAVIKMRQNAPNRNALMDTGAAGPLYGFIVAIAAVILGVCLSPVLETEFKIWGGMRLGESLLFYCASYLIKGVHPSYLELNPVLFAGWLGFFLTMLNLLPIGQLDGGHIIYAMFGKSKYYHIGVPIFFRALIVWGIISFYMFHCLQWLFLSLFLAYFSSTGDPIKDYVVRYLIMMSVIMSLLLNSAVFMVGAGIIAFVLLRKAGIHPPLDNEMANLTMRNKLKGALCILVFVLTFVPVPFKF